MANVRLTDAFSVFAICPFAICDFPVPPFITNVEKPSPNPPGTAIFGFVRLCKKRFLQPFKAQEVDISPTNRQPQSILFRAFPPAVAAHASKSTIGTRKSAMPRVYKFSAHSTPVFPWFSAIFREPGKENFSLRNPKSPFR